MITAAAAVVRALELEGVSMVFGYPGAAICPVYSELSRSAIRHILVRQEQNAGHAASGYARVSGQAGVCLATSGPGATNLITALATAYMDSVALVAITGQVSSDLLGRDVFQEADITGAAEPFTKHSYLVKDARQIPRVLREAFYIASTGRHGPVLVDIPMDVLDQRIEFEYPRQVDIRGYKPSTKGNRAQLGRVLEAMRASVRPVLCLGGGVFGANAQEEARRLAEACSLPTVTTMMGLGALPGGHPLHFGMLGISGGRTANQAVAESDLLILVGARAGDRALSAPGVHQRRTRIVHIDVDPAEIGKVMETNIPLVGDARQVLLQILEQPPRVETADWLDTLRAWRREERPRRREATSGVGPNRLLAQLSGRMDPDAVYVADVGQNQIWSARNIQVREGRFLTSGGMGTMGYSLPAAIGAKLAAPGRQVIAVCGDGAFQMQLPELATMMQHGAPVKLLVLCNGQLGMVREVQRRDYGGAFLGVELGALPDCRLIAQAYGVPSGRLERDEDAPAALDAFFAADGPYLLQCLVDPDEPSL